jgi:hypothetical protein
MEAYLRCRLKGNVFLSSAIASYLCDGRLGDGNCFRDYIAFAMLCGSITKQILCAQEKLRLKEEKMKAEEKYMHALVDGRKEKVGNFRVEPPGLFRGRGEHPKMGKLKARIYPRDITINIGKGVPVPTHPYPDQKCVVQILPLPRSTHPSSVHCGLVVAALLCQHFTRCFAA